jgi:hypothetical protein
LADRFIERLRSTEAIFGPEIEVLPLDELHAVVRRAEATLAVRAPSLSCERRARCARVSVELIRSLLPLVVATDPAERDAMVAELKAAARAKLLPVTSHATLLRFPRVEACIAA